MTGQAISTPTDDRQLWSPDKRSNVEDQSSSRRTALTQRLPSLCIDVGRFRALAQDRPGLSPHSLLLLIALALAVTYRGGYYTDGQRLVGMFLGSAVIVALMLRGHLMADFAAYLWVFSSLAIWAIASAAMAGPASTAKPLLGLLAAFASVLLICRRTLAEEREALVAGALTIGVLCALGGWVGVAWRLSPLALEADGLWRAASSFTYANATAALLAPLSLLALAHLTREPHRLWRSLTTSWLLLGLGASLSRGGIAAFVVGLSLLCVLLGTSRVLRTSVAPITGAVVAFAGLCPSIPGMYQPRPVLAILGLVGGLGAVMFISGPFRRYRTSVVAFVLAFIVLLPSGISLAAIGFISKRRFHFRSDDRVEQIMAAIQLFKEEPFNGVGPGNADLLWMGSESTHFVARYVHNEYLQVLVELGAIGLVLLVAVMVTLVRTVAKGCRWAPSKEVWAGAAAGLSAFGFHGALDFVWHLPAILLFAALLVGIASPIAKSTVRNPRPRRYIRCGIARKAPAPNGLSRRTGGRGPANPGLPTLSARG